MKITKLQSIKIKNIETITNSGKIQYISWSLSAMRQIRSI